MAHIKSLDIKSFRGISSLKLEDLSPINILTGDNNSGKTSVLEVLRSYEDFANVRVWMGLLRRETSRIGIPGSLSIYEGFYDLFNINEEDKKVEYVIESTQGGKDTVDHILFTAAEGERELTQKEYRELLSGVRAGHDSEGDDLMVIVSDLDIRIIVNGIPVYETSVVEGQWNIPYKNNAFLQRKDAKKIIYISPSSHTKGHVYLSEILKHPDLYEEMLEVLKDYDEDIISINYDNDSKYTNRGIYKILSRSYKEALPLNMYGDGMKKAILLMSAVLKAQDGILLLDEFETAIHTSAMDRTFRWILETCLKLNVQVFLTSHSKEAIEKVLKCSDEVRKNIALYTLYKKSSGTFARRLSGEKALEAQDEMGLELR